MLLFSSRNYSFWIPCFLNDAIFSQKSLFDIVRHSCSSRVPEVALTSHIVVYHGSLSVDSLPEACFSKKFLQKLPLVFKRTSCLRDSFVSFASKYPHLCLNFTKTRNLSTSMSHPCLSASVSQENGPSRILPFLFLGSEADCQDETVLKVSLAVSRNN
jgi:hypothetical protein